MGLSELQRCGFKNQVQQCKVRYPFVFFSTLELATLWIERTVSDIDPKQLQLCVLVCFLKGNDYISKSELQRCGFSGVSLFQILTQNN